MRTLFKSVFLLTAFFLLSTREAFPATISVSENSGSKASVIGADGLCTLREAMLAAQSNAAKNECPKGDDLSNGGDKIILPPGTYNLNAHDNDYSGPNLLAVVQSKITLQGAGAQSTIIQRDVSLSPMRLFAVGLQGKLYLRDLTVKNGLVINNFGGALTNGGYLNIEHCLFEDNRAESLGGGGGGALYSTGTVDILYSTFTDNHVKGSGGAIFAGNGTLNATNSTFHNNSSVDSTGGGAIYASGNAVLNIIHSTFSKNSAANSGGGAILTWTAAKLNIKASLLADNSPDNCAGYNKNSLGFNLEDESSCGTSTVKKDILFQNPKFISFGDHGGPTPTLSIDPSSPAIDKIPAASCEVASDQRNLARPKGAGCDIGAYEAGPGFAMSTGEIHFPETVTGQTSVQTLTLTNSGELPLHIQSVFLSGISSSNFKIDSDTCSGREIAPGASCGLNATFSPTELGELSGEITIANDVDSTPDTVALFGKGLAPSASGDGFQDFDKTSLQGEASESGKGLFSCDLNSRGSTENSLANLGILVILLVLPGFFRLSYFR